MRKFLTSFFFVLAFGLYAFERHNYTAAPMAEPIAVVTETPTSSEAVTTPVVGPTPTPKPTGQYIDGAYTGVVADAYYGNVQVQAVVSGGKLTNINFLQYPNDRNTSREISSRSLPVLRSEAIRAQSANVNTVSGASDTSSAFRQSLAAALSQARG